MSIKKDTAHLFDGFSKLDLAGRFDRLKQMGALTSKDIEQLKTGKSVDVKLAEHFIENVLGYFQMPLGVATNFQIDGKDYVIPMAVEETSIIAAASKMAKWIRKSGSITTEVLGNCLIGQIQIARVANLEKLQATIIEQKQEWIRFINEDIAQGLVRRGGGLQDIALRTIPRPDGETMAVIHVHVNTVDAMGANIVNQVCEALKGPIEASSDEKVTMCILSNLNDQKLTKVTVTLKNIQKELGEAITEASLFSQLDPYRAATNNKGVLNGMDAVLLATGNDWRAVEAGVHAYACRDGQYRSITTWKMCGNDLVGTLEAPILVGTVGGVTKLHPTAQLCLGMLGINSADELSKIVGTVGLVQNLGAINALATVGITQGHMKLHIANLTLSAGAKSDEIPLLTKKLEELLKLTNRITLSNALEILNELRLAAKRRLQSKKQTVKT